MSVGKQLRDARLARRLSLTDVTTATKIQPWVLEAMEADKLHDQMSPIYARGFLGSYARFLKIPPEPLLAEIQWPEAQAVVQNPSLVQIQLELKQQASSLVSARSAAVEAPAKATVNVAAPEPVKKAESLPRAVKIQMPKIEMPKITIPWGRIAEAVMRLAKPVAVVVAVVGIVVVNPLRWLPKVQLPKITMPAASAPKMASNKQANNKKVAAKPQPQPLKLASVAPVPIAQAQPVPAAQPAPTPKIEPLELSVSAAKATWIRVRADGKLVSQQRLERGAREKWIAKKSFDVVVAKPSQVELSLNGQSINAAAIQNEGRLAITHQGISKLADDAT